MPRQARGALARCHAGARGGAPQIRKERKTDWTQAKRAKFVEALAEVCNVTRAVKAAGMKSSTHVYALRKSDPGFAEAWDEALLRGYDRLELALLDRAINGARKIELRGDREIAVRQFNDGHALKLLQMHRETATRLRERQGARDPEAAFGEIVLRFAELRARIAEEPETGE